MRACVHVGEAPQESEESFPLYWFVGGHQCSHRGLTFYTVPDGFSWGLVSGDVPLRGSVDDGL